MARVLLVVVLAGSMALWGCSGGQGEPDGYDGGDGVDGATSGDDHGDGDGGGGDEGCAGADCCDQPGDCPPQYSSASVCRYPDGVTDCQGKRKEAVCVDRVCESVEVDDDSGCDGLKLNCPDHFAPVVCTAEEDQPVAQCKQDCTGNADCEAPFECNVGNGDCECPGGNQETHCTDNQDNDCDGLTDCGDGDCSQDAACTCTPDEANEATCGDGRDNDCDGDPDCRDSDCAQDPCGANGQVCNQSSGQCECPHGEGTESTCGDGTDNDCDGATDCDDPHCNGRVCGVNGEECIGAACQCPGPRPEALCMDGVDNDCDGRTDCEDTDCAHDPSSCGLELIGGINIGGGDDWFCVYAGHQIWSSPDPGAVFAISHHGRWHSVYTAGGCYFMDELMEGFCNNPTCTASQWCTPQNVCEDLPVPAPAGALNITGMGVPVTLNPDGNGLYPDAHLSGNEGFTSASVVTLTAAGGQTPAFSLTIDGVDMVAPPITCEPNLPPADQDYVITWTPASGESWVRLTLPTWHHAGMGSAIVCEVPDHAGRLVVPAVMINYYLGAGAVPERTYNIARFNRGVADIGGGYGVAFELHLSQYCDFFH